MFTYLQPPIIIIIIAITTTTIIIIIISFSQITAFAVRYCDGGGRGHRKPAKRQRREGCVRARGGHPHVQGQVDLRNGKRHLYSVPKERQRPCGGVNLQRDRTAREHLHARPVPVVEAAGRTLHAAHHGLERAHASIRKKLPLEMQRATAIVAHSKTTIVE